MLNFLGVKSFRWWWMGGAMALLTMGCQPSGPATNKAEKTALMDQLPSFQMQMPDGQKLNIQSLKGKKIMVNLWATWCPPCRQEMPSIAALYASIDTSKTQLILLSLDDKQEKAVQFLAGHFMSGQLYFPGEDLPDLFNVQGIPATFIFDENGKLIKQVMGGSNYDTDEYRNLLK